MAIKNENKSVPVKRKRKQEAKGAGGHLMHPLEDIDMMFDRFMNRIYPGGWHLPSRWDWPEMPQPFAGKRPNVDVIDRDNEILVRAELPGVEKKDIDVSVDNSTLTIRASSSYEKKESEENYYRSEMAHGSFSRTISLPCEVDDKKADAKFSNGILELSMPKLPGAKRRRIAVK